MGQAKWENKKWLLLGSGSYNTVYRSDDGLHVLKIPQDDSPSDTPERAVRLWREINPDLPAILMDVTQGTSQCKGWVCPYIDGVRASDQETSDCIIDIFNRTGRIVCDGPADTSTNFKKTSSGRVVCVDVGLALHLEIRNKVVFAKNLIRCKSTVSLDTWKEYADQFYNDFFPATQLHSPKTVQTIQALLFIKIHRPNILNVNFLKQLPDLTAELVKGLYDEKKTKGALARLDKLMSPVPLSANPQGAKNKGTANVTKTAKGNATYAAIAVSGIAASATAVARGIAAYSGTVFFKPEKGKGQEGQQPAAPAVKK